MVKAVFIASDTYKDEEICSTLKSHGIYKSNFVIDYTEESQSIFQKLSVALSIPKAPIKSLPFMSEKALQVLSLLDAHEQILIIEKSNVLQKALQHLLKSTDFFDFSSNIYIIYKEDSGYCTKPLKVGSQSFQIEQFDDDEEDLNDPESKFLQIANSTTLKFIRNYPQVRIKAYENAKTNISLALDEMSYLSKRLKSIGNILKENNESRHETDNESFECVKLLEETQNLCREIQVLKISSQEITTNLVPEELEPNFGVIEFPLEKYNVDMIMLQECQSNDHSEHVFTITNLTGYELNDLRIFQSDSPLPINSFSLKPNESIIKTEEFLLDVIKYRGIIEFQVYYCSFPLSRPAESCSVTIFSVTSVPGEKFKFVIEYKSHAIGTTGVLVMGNETVLLRNQRIKLFNQSTLTFDVPAQFKGDADIYFNHNNKRISNKKSIRIS
ncbi:hypothetical protein SteCoe_37060 [Stentor coeruleus]|uniref:Uncharacterized protein n=1 Tax=Stentor coeruleus TaxID=5963 RepID=A0A1R2ANV2_9CILI|nr:hypothetical protein SteCoe_37060 [Stentor coeruleus]